MPSAPVLRYSKRREEIMIEAETREMSGTIEIKADLNGFMREVSRRWRK